MSLEDFLKNITVLEISPEHEVLKGHVKSISNYKGRLDAALVAKRNEVATEDQEAWLLSEGFTRPSPNGTGVSADTFAKWVFGPFFRRRDMHERERVLTFPGYFAIGWNRRQYGQVDLTRALEIKRLLDVDSCDTSASDGYARWLAPLPAVVATEGKHRVDLFRQHGLEMVAKVFPTLLPSASDLQLCKIWGTKDVWALQCKNPTFIGGNESNIALLPLPHLSVPLFLDYGVTVRQLRLSPWMAHSRELRDTGWTTIVRPERWRTALLNAGYI